MKHVATSLTPDKATEKVPGVGVRINGPLALKFIEMMKAKKPAATQS